MVGRPSHAEIEVQVEAVAGDDRGQERVGALGSQRRVAAHHLQAEARRQRAVEHFDAAGERHRIELDDAAAGKLQERLRTAGGPGVFQPHDGLAGRAVNDAAGPEQPGLERRRGAGPELQHHARVERRRRFEFERRQRRDRKLQLREAVHERIERNAGIGAPGADGRSGKNDMPASSPLFASPRARLAISCNAGAVSASGMNRPASCSSTRRGSGRVRTGSPIASSNALRLATRLAPSNVGVPHPYRDCSSPTGSVNSFG